MLSPHAKAVLSTSTPRSSFAERALFLRSFLAHPRHVGAVLPTSRRAVLDLLGLARFDDARCVVEFGAGTGPYTRELVRRLAPDARLLAFELDAALAAALAEEVKDPRLRVVNDSAANVERYLDGSQVDVLVSALPFTSLPPAVRRDILTTSRRVLAQGGTMLVLQYSPLIRAELGRTFGSVEQRLSPLNVPPAFLYRCRAEPMPTNRSES